MNNSEQERIFTFEEAMSYLRVSRSTLYRLMEDGKLTGYKVGHLWRFYKVDLDACIEKQQTVAIVRPIEQRKVV